MHLTKTFILSLAVLISFLLLGEKAGQSFQEDQPLNFISYFPYFLNEESQEGTKTTLQILNTSDFTASFKIIFYPVKNSTLPKVHSFELEPRERLDLGLSSLISFSQGAIEISASQSYAAQVALLKKDTLWQAIAPGYKSLLNAQGSAFEILLPSSVVESQEAEIYIFNPNRKKIKVTLQDSSAESQDLKSFSIAAFGSRLLPLTPYIEKRDGLSLKLISSEPITAVIKIKQDKEEKFIPLNPDLSVQESSYQQYILPFFDGGGGKDFRLFLENKDAVKNRLNLSICTQQEETLFFLEKDLVLGEHAPLQLNASDLQLDTTDLSSLKHLGLESEQDFTARGICSLSDLPLQTVQVPGLRPVPLEDQIPPASPVLNRVITPTLINKQIITGTKDKDSCLWLNDQPIIPFDDQTQWQYELPLQKGENPIQLAAKDRGGNASDPVTAVIILDSYVFGTGSSRFVEEAKDKGVDAKAAPSIIEDPLEFPVAPTLDPFASVMNDYNVKITYSEEMVGADQAANYAITPSLGTISVVSLGGPLYRIRTQLPAQPNVTYTIEVHNVTDRQGHPIDPEHDTARFTGSVYGHAVLLHEFTGEGEFNYFGKSTAPGGDINGDGFDDVLIGAPGYSVKDLNAGRVYVYYGNPNVNAPDIFIDGENDDDQFGYAVSSAGDVNGDGYSDFLVGAPYNDANGSNAGQVYLYFGGGLEEINSLDPAADLKFTGESAGDNFGAFVTSLGDINKDGYGDFFVGAPYNDHAAENAGAGYVYLGGPNLDAQPDLILYGEGKWDYSGSSAAGIGDFNQDGYGDFAVGAYAGDQKAVDAGKVNIYFGGAPPNPVADVSLAGEKKGDYFGYSIAGAEVNGDQAVDLLIGAYASDQKAQDAGKIYVYFAIPTFNKEPNLVISGETAGDYFGYALSSAGDLNGDGQGDFLVGAYGYDGDAGNAGRVYGFYGGTVLDTTPDVIMEGSSSRDYFGASVSSAGKFNEDDTAEILIGARGADGAQEDSGKVYLMTANFGEKRPYITWSSLAAPRTHLSGDILKVELTFNEKMNQELANRPTIYLGKTYPYEDYFFKCRWDDDYSCTGYYNVEDIDQELYVVKIKGGKNFHNVAMKDNAYFNFVFDQTEPRLDPNAIFVDANNVVIIYNEDMIYADFSQNYEINPPVNIGSIQHEGYNLTHYRLVTKDVNTRFRPGVTYTITARNSITDLAKNPLEPGYNAARFTAIDNGLPLVNSFDIFDLDTGNQEFTNSTTVGVRMTDNDQDGAVVKWFITTSPDQPQPQDFILTSRPTSYILAGGNGPKDLYAWVLDRSDNVSVYANTSHDSIELDARGPDVILNPIDPNPSALLRVTITGTVAPDRDDKFSNIHVDITGDILNAPIRVSVNSDFTFSANVTLSSGDGNKTVTAAAFDQFNNPGDSDTQSVMLDTTAPAQPAVNPLTTPTNIAPIILTGTKTLDTEKVIVKLNGTAINTVVYPSPGTWSCDLILAEGQNVLEAVSQDLAGNASAPVTARVLLDTTAPVLEMIYPTEGSVVNGKGKI